MKQRGIMYLDIAGRLLLEKIEPPAIFVADKRRTDIILLQFLVSFTPNPLFLNNCRNQFSKEEWKS